MQYILHNEHDISRNLKATDAVWHDVHDVTEMFSLSLVGIMGLYGSGGGGGGGRLRRWSLRSVGILHTIGHVLLAVTEYRFSSTFILK